MSESITAATIAVANAPCSYGAFEETIGIDPAVPDAIELLDDVAAAGYAGIDLGPVGYLGDASQLRERLEEHGLSLAGGFLELSFAEPDRLSNEMAGLELLLDAFELAGQTFPDPDLRWLPAAMWHAHFHLQRVSNGHGPPVSGERSRMEWRGPPQCAESVGTSQRSITTSEPTSRRHNRSIGCSRSLTSDCALIPGISSSQAAIPLMRSAVGASGSTMCT